MSKVSDDIIYGRQALHAGEPWIVPEALTYLSSIIQPSWRVFEWGSGGSTVYFARRCASVVSIEHHDKWYYDTQGKLSRELTSPVDLKYIPLRPGDESYPDAILDYPDNYFNLVFVDGEVTKRDRSLDNSWAKVVPDGYVMLDNSNWWKGSIPMGWSRVDFMEKGLQWVGVVDPFDWWTSFFNKVSAEKRLSTTTETDHSSERANFT